MWTPALGRLGERKMKNKEVIIEQQKDFIQEMKDKTLSFINSIDKSEIETILLSGSVARRDYFPEKKENGEYNGMVDLIVMRKNASSVTAEDIFGANQESGIPFHCLKIDGVWFEILFTDFIDKEKLIHIAHSMFLFHSISLTCISCLI